MEHRYDQLVILCQLNVSLAEQPEALRSWVYCYVFIFFLLHVLAPSTGMQTEMQVPLAPAQHKPPSLAEMYQLELAESRDTRPLLE